MSSAAERFLGDIREYAKRAAASLEGVEYLAFLEDGLLTDATIRRLEVVGEASRRLLDSGAPVPAGLPLRGLAAMRNVLIHQYEYVDLSLVYREVRTNFPVYLQAIGR